MNITNQNIDPQEIQKFETIASHWWDLQGAFATLHAINPLRLAFITQYIDLSAKKAVDVGCGGGILTESLAKQGAEVLGIDLSSKALQIAKQHALAQALPIHYQQITVEALANTAAQTFDVVTCMELLEHVPDPSAIVNACAKLVKPNGDIFFSTLNRNFKSYVLAIIGAEYVLKLLPKGTHDYAKFIRPAELARWLRQANLSIAHTSGITYNPLTKSYRLTDNIDVNYLIHCKKC